MKFRKNENCEVLKKKIAILLGDIYDSQCAHLFTYWPVPIPKFLNKYICIVSALLQVIKTAKFGKRCAVSLKGRKYILDRLIAGKEEGAV